jgi:predicted TIM-barrel fold metal-dependent hydrolase
LIIDAHAHIFPEVRGFTKEGATKGVGYGAVTVGDRKIQVIPPLCPSTIHTPEMLVGSMDWAGVDRAVLLQGPFYGESNQYVSKAVRRYPDRLIGLAYLDPWDSGSHSMFDTIRQTPEFVGVKIEFSEATGLRGIHPFARIDDSGIDWFWVELERSGMVLVIDLGAIGSSSYQTAALRRIAIRHADLTIVIAHLAQPRPAAESDPNCWCLWIEQIRLGSLPNVYFDTASLPAYVAEDDYPFARAGRYMHEAISQIGSGKIMWGTDIPALLTVATYPQLLRSAKASLDWLSQGERNQILGENAAAIYKRKPS